MAATPSIVIKFQFSYRGGTRIWSTRIHFNGGTPSSNAHWETLFDNVVASIKNDVYTFVEIVEIVGYAAGSDVAVDQKAYSQAGLIPLASDNYRVPGEAVGLLRWATPARSTKNHPIYLFNYFHGAARAAADPDTPSNDFKSGIENIAAFFMSSGFTDGVNVYTRAGPNGVTASGYQVDAYLTHRDFPR